MKEMNELNKNNNIDDMDAPVISNDFETPMKHQKLKVFNKLKAWFSVLSTGKKVQFIAASVLSLVLLIGLTVYAWFALGGKLEAFTKIKEPDALDIRAGHYDAVQYFNLDNIDIESISTGTPHRVVFSVSAGDYKIPYQIQLAHTTNIPFKYRIFRASESSTVPQGDGVEYVTYVSEPMQNQGMANYTFYYTKKTKVVDGETVYDEIVLTPKNPDSESSGTYGRQLALGSGNYYSETYDTANGDAPEIYAIPIYEQSGEIRNDSNSEHDYFILEISWDSKARQTDNFSEWNTAENKKETDMIYLTAIRFAQ